jgi:RHS repeat-associated protein
MVTPSSWAGSRFRYTGQIVLDPDHATETPVALYHYKARVYDPVLGRFQQTDPVGYEDDRAAPRRTRAGCYSGFAPRHIMGRQVRGSGGPAMAKTDHDDPRKASAVDRKIGARIRERRLEVSKSQTALADAIGVTFQQIQKYENGVNRVSASKLLEIADALDAPVLTLLPTKQPGGPAHAGLDDPELHAWAPLLGELNPEGRRVLARIARSFAQDAKLRASSKRRGEG